MNQVAGAKPKTILVVDDTEATRYAIARILRAEGFQILEAANGTDAIRISAESLPDLITLDIHLPDIMGFEVCRRIKGDPRTQMIPVLQVSASYVTSKDKILGLEGGADSYLTHPVEPPVLVATVKALLRFRSLNEELERSEEQLRVAVTSADMGLLDYNPEIDLFRLSAKTKAITGLTSDDPPRLEQVFGVLVPEDRERTLAGFRKSLEPSGNGEYKEEFRLRLPSGELRWVIGRGQTLFSGIGETRKAKRHVGTVVDVTARKIAESQLQEAKDSAEAASLAKTRFLANVSHEIRTPLGVILGLSELLQGDPQAAAEYVTVIRRNAELLSKLIDEILDVSKIEADRMEIETVGFSLRALVTDVITILSLKAREKSLELSESYDKDAPDFVHGDPTRLRQILINLLGNALKFTERGSVQLKVSVASHEADLWQLKFSVCDTGLGLDAKQSERLFQPFTQADSSTTRRFGGTGLGLMLSRKLARAMGGDLVLTSSTPGEGSVFTLSLELRSAHAPEAVAPAAKSKLKALAGLHVLLVEDSPDNQMMVRRFLDLEGATVEIAGDGEEGVAKACSGTYDVVLMDIQMPKLDGYEAVQRLRGQGYKKPVIALTAHALKGERERCLALGFSDYLTKPLSRPRLVEVLSHLK